MSLATSILVELNNKTKLKQKKREPHPMAPLLHAASPKLLRLSMDRSSAPVTSGRSVRSDADVCHICLHGSMSAYMAYMECLGNTWRHCMMMVRYQADSSKTSDLLVKPHCYRQ